MFWAVLQRPTCCALFSRWRGLVSEPKTINCDRHLLLDIDSIFSKQNKHTTRKLDKNSPWASSLGLELERSFRTRRKHPQTANLTKTYKNQYVRHYKLKINMAAAERVQGLENSTYFLSLSPWSKFSGYSNSSCFRLSLHYTINNKSPRVSTRTAGASLENFQHSRLKAAVEFRPSAQGPAHSFCRGHTTPDQSARSSTNTLTHHPAKIQIQQK